VEKLDSIDDEDASSDEYASSDASSDGDHFPDEDGTTDEDEFTGDDNSIGEQESKGLANEDRCHTDKQDQQQAMQNFRVLFMQPEKSQRNAKNWNGSVGQRVIELNSGDLEEMGAASMQMATAGKQLGAAILLMDLEQIEVAARQMEAAGTLMSTALTRMQSLAMQNAVQNTSSELDEWKNVEA
jgi:hypothetical protein